MLSRKGIAATAGDGIATWRRAKKFPVYANCQGSALGRMLLENPAFGVRYELDATKPVQTLTCDLCADSRAMAGSGGVENIFFPEADSFMDA